MLIAGVPVLMAAWWLDAVLIPKFSTYARSTVDALTRYHDYLVEHFPVHEESPSWTILTRRSAIAGSR